MLLPTYAPAYLRSCLPTLLPTYAPPYLCSSLHTHLSGLLLVQCPETQLSLQADVHPQPKMLQSKGFGVYQAIMSDASSR